MGGRDYTQHGRGVRPAALLCALGTLVAALFLCAPRAAGDSPAGRAAARGHAAAHPVGAAAAAADAAHVCPYEPPGCSAFSHQTPGVLPVPPPVVAAPGAGGAPRVVPAGAPGGRVPVEPQARGPDLHVLQVLRT
ncbi:hypothetical protein [Streptomyces sp. NPDC012888]|uniref:hypothetical protein n=1 Tax=Streptomyces sp. NPDC012888 TaxID=3364855 RepID=UPI0036991E39